MKALSEDQIKETIMPYLFEPNTEEIREQILKDFSQLLSEDNNTPTDIEDTTTHVESSNGMLSFIATDESISKRFTINLTINE